MKLIKISPYVVYTTKGGYPVIKARIWHPAFFMPILRIQLKYWLGFFARHKAMQKAMAGINETLSQNLEAQDKLNVIEALAQRVDCGYGCDDVQPYGFVPEAGCPIHDRRDWLDL